MKRSHRRAKRLISLALVLMLMLALMPAASAADTGLLPAVSDNLNNSSYLRYGTEYNVPNRSYLFENEEGGLTRVEYITGGSYGDGTIVVEDYTSDFVLTSQRTIPTELEIWGGFFAGEKYNFFIFGQRNPDQADSHEVIRVVKYSKDWTRLGAATLRGANTVEPFAYGSLDCAEYRDMLYIRTCHDMYISTDGRERQASMTIAVRQSDMKVTDSSYAMLHPDVGYVTRSLNQFVMVDDIGRIVTVDHGDNFPRSIVLNLYNSLAGGALFSGQTFERTIHNVQGFIGDMSTGTSLGGFAETKNGYVVAFNSNIVGGMGVTYPRHAYIVYTGKYGSFTLVHMLADVPGTTAPMIASFGTDGGYAMWNYYDGDDTLYTARYYDEGVVDPVKTTKGLLSECKPILYNGKNVWYTTNNSVPTFYSMDKDGNVTAKAASTTFSFTDVAANMWYHPYIRTAYTNGLMKGSGAVFEPEKNLTLAETATLAARIHAETNGKTFTEGGTPWYSGAYNYCVANGLISSSELSLADMERPATRYEVVSMLNGAIPAERLNARVNVADNSIPDVPTTDKYAGVVYRWYRAGILTGSDGGKFLGSTNIQRCEIAAILCRVYDLSV